MKELVITPQFTGGGGVGWGGRLAHGRPWLPRGGATALGGGATELMGDVVILLLSERDKQTGETKRKRSRGEELKKQR